MLVSATEMLKKAVEGKYAVGQFNINNLEWTKSILATAQENSSPVILGVSAVSYTHLDVYKRQSMPSMRTLPIHSMYIYTPARHRIDMTVSIPLIEAVILTLCLTYTTAYADSIPQPNISRYSSGFTITNMFTSGSDAALRRSSCDSTNIPANTSTGFFLNTYAINGKTT